MKIKSVLKILFINSKTSYFLITGTNYWCRVNHRKFKKPFFDLYQQNAYNGCTTISISSFGRKSISSNHDSWHGNVKRFVVWFLKINIGIACNHHSCYLMHITWIQMQHQEMHPFHLNMPLYVCLLVCILWFSRPT